MNATVEERLDRVEREVRRWRRAACAGAAVALALVAFRALAKDAAADPKEGPISIARAGEFDLTDAKGTRTAALVNSTDGGAHLLFFGTKGLPLVDIGVVAGDRTQIAQFSADGKTRFLSVTDAKGLPRLQLDDATDSPRMVLATEPTGNAAVALLGPSKTLRLLLVTGPDGTPAIQVLDKDQKVVWGAPPAK